MTVDWRDGEYQPAGYQQGHSPQADCSVQLLKDSWTCQPRVFSPAGRRAPHTETTISFQLDKSAEVSIKV